MRITELQPEQNGMLSIVAEDDRIGQLDMSPNSTYEEFNELMKLVNGGFIR